MSPVPPPTLRLPPLHDPNPPGPATPTPHPPPRLPPPGPVRIGIIFLASAFGANFLSMTYEDPCVVYVGASGAVFGFIGLAISGGWLADCLGGGATKDVGGGG